MQSREYALIRDLTVTYPRYVLICPFDQEHLQTSKSNANAAGGQKCSSSSSLYQCTSCGSKFTFREISENLQMFLKDRIYPVAGLSCPNHDDQESKIVRKSDGNLYYVCDADDNPHFITSVDQFPEYSRKQAFLEFHRKCIVSMMRLLVLRCSACCEPLVAVQHPKVINHPRYKQFESSWIYWFVCRGCSKAYNQRELVGNYLLLINHLSSYWAFHCLTCDTQLPPYTERETTCVQCVECCETYTLAQLAAYAYWFTERLKNRSLADVHTFSCLANPPCDEGPEILNVLIMIERNPWTFVTPAQTGEQEEQALVVLDTLINQSNDRFWLRCPDDGNRMYRSEIAGPMFMCKDCCNEYNVRDIVKNLDIMLCDSVYNNIGFYCIFCSNRLSVYRDMTGTMYFDCANCVQDIPAVMYRTMPSYMKQVAEIRRRVKFHWRLAKNLTILFNLFCQADCHQLDQGCPTPQPCPANWPHIRPLLNMYCTDCKVVFNQRQLVGSLERFLTAVLQKYSLYCLACANVLTCSPEEEGFVCTHCDEKFSAQEIAYFAPWFTGIEKPSPSDLKSFCSRRVALSEVVGDAICDSGSVLGTQVLLEARWSNCRPNAAASVCPGATANNQCSTNNSKGDVAKQQGQAQPHQSADACNSCSKPGSSTSLAVGETGSARVQFQQLPSSVRSVALVRSPSAQIQTRKMNDFKAIMCQNSNTEDL